MRKYAFLVYMSIGFFVALLLYVTTHGFPSFAGSSDGTQAIEQAERDYGAGEKATEIAERKASFNRALKTFILLETRYKPAYGNGKLYFDIANSYYQLGEYPFAVYYFERALALNPTSEEIRNNLSLALKKLNLKPQREGKESVFQQVFFFHYLLSLPTRLTLFFIFSLATIILLSIFIWKRGRWLHLLIALTGMATFLFLTSVLYTRYIAPIEGIIVQASVIYRDAGEQYAKVTDKPIQPGLKVEILDKRQGGRWLKILTPEGTLGYVKQEAVRII